MKIKSEAKMRAAVAVKMPLIVLDAEQLKQVSGGLAGPNGGWSQASSVPTRVTAAGPNGGWAIVSSSAGPNGGW